MPEASDQPRAQNREVCAVVVTFNPGADIGSHLQRLAASVAHLIVVDNTPVAESPIPSYVDRDPAVEILRSGRNLGPASALNMGIKRALGLGYLFVLILDQDSVPQPRMIEELVEVYRTHPERDRIALVAPQPIDPLVSKPPRFLRSRGRGLFQLVECHSRTLDDVTIVIASGCLLPSSTFLNLGPFRDDYFIDYTDTEYCLRALSRGYQIVVAGHAHLHHRIGSRRAATWGPFTLIPTMHVPSRWYYMARNRIPTLAQYGRLIPHWCMFELAHSTYAMMRMLVSEDKRLEKLAAFVRGTWDGLHGRLGPMPGKPGADP